MATLFSRSLVIYLPLCRALRGQFVVVGGVAGPRVLGDLPLRNAGEDLLDESIGMLRGGRGPSDDERDESAREEHEIRLDVLRRGTPSKVRQVLVHLLDVGRL